MFAQISDLQLWHALVQKYISETAIIDEDTVFIYANGFIKVPVYDSASVMQMMNINPHLLQDTYRIWERGEDNIQKAFCEALYHQMQTEVALSDEVAMQAVRDAFSQVFIGGTLLSLVDAFLDEGFEVITFKPQQEIPGFAEEIKQPILQNALFSALKK